MPQDLIELVEAAKNKFFCIVVVSGIFVPESRGDIKIFHHQDEKIDIDDLTKKYYNLYLQKLHIGTPAVMIFPYEFLEGLEILANQEELGLLTGENFISYKGQEIF